MPRRWRNLLQICDFPPLGTCLDLFRSALEVRKSYFAGIQQYLESTEASWGADPLEYYGGFRSLLCDSKATYPSSLGSKGQIRWAHCQADVIHQLLDAVEIALEISFPNTEWHWLQQIYGWAALQYQAWARGILTVIGNEPQAVVLYTDNVLEFWVDDKPYFGGDCYAYRRAPLVLSLQPGAHKIDIRIVRDVRMMGGMGSTTLITMRAERSGGRLVALEKKLLVSDVVNSTLASPYAALPVRNDGLRPVSIRKVEAVNVSTNKREVKNLRLR